MPSGHGDVQVFVTLFGDDATAGRASEEAKLDEIGLVYFFDSAHFFTDDGGDSLDTSGATAEFLDEGAEDMMVGWLESEVIDFEEVERFLGGGGVDGIVAMDLGVVADTLQDAVRDARCLAAGPRDDFSPFLIEFDAEYA